MHCGRPDASLPAAPVATATGFNVVDKLVVDIDHLQQVVPPSLTVRIDGLPDDKREALLSAAPLARGVRERTPLRRASETVTVKLGGCSHYFTVSQYDDGRPCEVFIVAGKEGSALRGMYDALGIVLSHYLQIGGSVEDIAEKLRHIHFAPAGPVTGAPLGIERATSPIDALAQLLALQREPDE